MDDEESQLIGLLAKKKKSNDTVDYRNKRKYAGAVKFKTKFNPDWTKKWPCIVAVPGSNHVHDFKCTVCCEACSCGHQGEADISRHLEGTKHKERVKSASTSQGLFECGFRLQNDPIKEQVCIKHSCNRHCKNQAWYIVSMIKSSMRNIHVLTLE
jgi:hypothetical protein